MKVLIPVLLSLALCVSSTFVKGPCPNVPLQPNFNITQYFGTWLELVRNIDMPFESGNCNQAQYSLNPDGTVRVDNSEMVNGVNETKIGYATCSKANPAICSVKFSALGPAGDYNVLKTDYLTYTVIYSCQQVALDHYIWAWVLARNPGFDYTQFLPTINSLGIPTDALYFTSQTGCPNAVDASLETI